MNLHFHRKSFSLLGLDPSISQASIDFITKIEQQNGVTLPAALREWYGIWDIIDLMEELFFIHLPTTLAELPRWVKSYPEQALRYPVLHIAWENQGVWSLGVVLSDEADPPVYLGNREDGF